MSSLGRVKRKKAQRYWQYLAQARLSSLEQDLLAASWLFVSLDSFGEF